MQIKVKFEVTWQCRIADLSGAEGQVQAAALLEKDLQAHILQLVGAGHDGHSLQKTGQVCSRHVPSHHNTANLQLITSAVQLQGASQYGKRSPQYRQMHSVCMHRA